MTKVKSKKKNSVIPTESFQESFPTVQAKEWEVKADHIIRTLGKHPYIDPLNKKVVASYYQDLSNLTLLLQTGGIRDEEDFYKKIISIFQNVVDNYQDRKFEGQEYFIHLVEASKHLLEYTKWICLENLVLQDDIADPNLKYGFLKVSKRNEERKIREQILEKVAIEIPPTSCRKVVKELERCKNKAEQTKLSYFLVPVNEKAIVDYSMYVRKPMDLGTVKVKLDALTPSSFSSSSSSSLLLSGKSPKSNISKYQTYGEFIDDLRRIFTNAIKFNGAHLTSDTTGVSKLVYDAAIVLQDRLESILSNFTIQVTDRVEITRHEQRDRGKEVNNLNNNYVCL
jgi:hypothetical protein